MIEAKVERYSRYKDSEIEWLGEVPAHWAEVRIKDLAFLERGKFTHRPRNDPQMYDGRHPFIQTGDVARANKYVTTYKQTLSDKGTEVSRKFKSGTLLMAIAANIGDVAIVNFDTFFPDSIVGFTPIKSDTDFLFYLFTATRSELDRVKVTSTQDNLNLERLNSLVKFSPPLLEQIEIAAYLDKKIEQIDRQIDLLDKKATQYGKLKQSLINETVTRGLDKNLPMKDSGVEWIGEVPEHWKVLRINDVAFQNKAKNSNLVETNLLSLSYGRIIRKDFNASFGLLPESFETYQVVNEGTVILRLTDLQNDQRSLRVGLVSERGIITSAYLGLVFNRSLNSNFAYYLLHVYDLAKVFYWFGGGLRSTMRFEDIKIIPFVIPPMDEQKAIVQYLNEKTTQIDSIVTVIHSQIDKLKDLRKVLINDIVTGKVRVVRDEVAI
jgi:type I restriction enzyme S subunit